jgi:hypothetical protein
VKIVSRCVTRKLERGNRIERKDVWADRSMRPVKRTTACLFDRIRSSYFVEALYGTRWSPLRYRQRSPDKTQHIGRPVSCTSSDPAMLVRMRVPGPEHEYCTLHGAKPSQKTAAHHILRPGMALHGGRVGKEFKSDSLPPLTNAGRSRAQVE